ncbi:SigE family RNA polymerase sigma factor [Streptomyces montanisoli]|uniref:SigE family RNA polymerase sigma factor n=1 Tax=Streptomyces montanisoli TaxID=2798581 RepID=A0A940MCA3_9ACTN|nr:SigE family RNA polymerase sigma factor [Streptomyces montanisoli]MBP0457751.1 SigE family RNA polymerase sigma factor [Streptomyces montanisoli]
MRSTSEQDREFSEYVRRRRTELVRLATLLLSGDPNRAEDAVQVALTRLYVAWPRIRPNTRDAYIRRCVVNATIDDRRSVFRRREQAHAEVPDVPAAELEVADHAGLVTLLDVLPARMRAAVVLRYVEGLDVADTARALGCREGTVRSQSARGLERLRANLTRLEAAHV